MTVQHAPGKPRPSGCLVAIPLGLQISRIRVYWIRKHDAARGLCAAFLSIVMSRAIVTIHGTGRTSRQFWVPQLQSIAIHLPVAPLHNPVWWGDLIDVGGPISSLGKWTNARLHSMAWLFLGRPARHTPRLVSSVADVLHRSVDGVAGVVAYFATAPRREEIRRRLSQALAAVTLQQHEIVLVSESLGSLVAFDVLRQEAERYKIAAWFTLGCPLRTLVRAGQRSTDLGAINPQTVGRWFNLYSTRDLVAAPIAPVFPAYPICDERIESARGRLQAHRYWANPRVSELIARAMEE